MKGLLDALAAAAGYTGLRESVNLYPGSAQIDSDEHLYRSLTAGTRDLSPDQYERVQKAAVRQFVANPFTRRTVELPRDFFTAEGVEPECPEDPPELRAWLDRFWDDPVNRMDHFVEVMPLEYELLGEVVVPLFVGPDGFVRITMADPLTVSRTIADPGNGRVIIGVEFKAPSGHEQEPLVFPVVLGVGADDATILSAEALAKRATWTTRLAGRYGPNGLSSAFYFGANMIAGVTRGLSTVSASLDHLDQLDRNQFDMLERPGLMNAFIWHVVLQGAQRPEIDQWRKDHPTPPRPGTVNVTNEKETWTPVTPDLKATDLSTGFQTGKNYIVGNLGYAPGWFGEMEQTRASAAEATDPALRTVSARQKRIRTILTAILRYVVWSAVQAQKLPATAKDKKGREVSIWSLVGVRMPEIAPKDVAQGATALAQVTAAAQGAVEARLMSRGTAIRLITAAAHQLGVDVDPSDEEAAVERQAEEADAAAYEQAAEDRAARLAADAVARAAKPALMESVPPPAAPAVTVHAPVSVHVAPAPPAPAAAAPIHVETPVTVHVPPTVVENRVDVPAPKVEVPVTVEGSHVTVQAPPPAQIHVDAPVRIEEGAVRVSVEAPPAGPTTTIVQKTATLDDKGRTIATTERHETKPTE
jgi:hypothetical protein